MAPLAAAIPEIVGAIGAAGEAAGAVGAASSAAGAAEGAAAAGGSGGSGLVGAAKSLSGGQFGGGSNPLSSMSSMNPASLAMDMAGSALSSSKAMGDRTMAGLNKPTDTSQGPGDSSTEIL